MFAWQKECVMEKKIILLLTSVLMMCNIMTFNINAEEGTDVSPDTPTVSETTEIEEGSDEDDDIQEEITYTEQSDETDTDDGDDVSQEDLPLVEAEDEITDIVNNGEDGENPEGTDENGTDGIIAIDDEEMTIEDLSDFIIQSGGYDTISLGADSGGAEIQAYGTGSSTLSVSYTSAELVMLNALKARASSVNVSAYKLSDAQFKNSFFKVINENADLFYVKSMIGWNRSGGYVNTAYFFYYDYSQADIDFFNQAVDSIIARVDPSWSDLQKAIYLHDWVESNCDYDFSFSRYNAYNVIVDGSAVCQGYALAYSLLCKRAGVQCQVVTSDALNHAWNVMKLNGEFFYIDATWDDYNGVSEHFCHEYFLCSRQQFYEKYHDSTDWKLNNASNAYSSISTSSRYDNAFWKNVEKPLSMYGNYTLFYDSYNYRLVVYDLVNEQIYRSYVPEDGQSYNYVNHFHAAADGTDNLYITDGYNIYSFDIYSGAQDLIYSLSAQETDLGTIFALGIKNHKVQYKLSNDWGQTYSMKGTIGAETIVRQNDSDNAVIIASDDEAMFTYLKQYNSSLNLIVNPGTGSEETFEFKYYEYGDLETINYFYDVVSPYNDDEYASITYLTLRNRSVPSGYAVIELDYNGKYYRSPEFYLNACGPAPDVSIYESGDSLVITSSDSAYLNALTASQTLNYKEEIREIGSAIELNVDGKEYRINNLRIIRNAYDKTSMNLIYGNGQVTISKEALVNSGVVNGSNVTADLYVNGYAKKTVTVYGGITLGCAAGNVDFDIYQMNNGDIIIESDRTEWLDTLLTAKTFVGENNEPSFADYGQIYGKYQNFTVGDVEMDLNIEMFNEHYNDHDKIAYYLSDGKIVIPSASLVEYNIPGGTYDLTIHVPGYEDNKVNSFSIESPVIAYAPSDLTFYNDRTYGIMVQTEDVKWISALENGKITVYDADDNRYVFDTSNCFTRLSGYNDVTYLSPGYLSGAGIKSGSYTVIFEPENYVSYAVRYKLYIDSKVKKMFTVKFFDDNDEMIKYVAVQQGGKASAPVNPTKNGYTFAGWTFKGNIFNMGKVVTENMDLHYSWKENTYKLAYNANGGKGTLEKTKSHSLNEQVFISDLVPTKNGYDFLGWSLDKKATVPTYLVGDDITAINYNSKNNATITLYAVYSDPVDYLVKLDPRGGELANKQVYDSRLEQQYDGTYEAIYNITSVTFKLPTLTKNGYKFNGWYDSSTGKKVGSLAKGSYGNKELYALFTPVSYRINYTLNKGTMVKGQVYSKDFNIETLSITLPVPTRKGYNFAGWYLDKNLTQRITSRDQLELKNTTLYAKWEPISYKVVFEYAGVRLDEISLTYDVVQTLDAPSFPGMLGKTPTKYSYVNDAGKIVNISSLKLKNLTAVEDRVIVLTPVTFKYVTYRVKYVLNGGRNASSNKTAYNVDNPITLAAPTKKNHVFLGWYDNPEFNGVPVTVLASGDYTLYARFTEADSENGSYQNGSTSGVTGPLGSRIVTRVQEDKAFVLEW